MTTVAEYRERKNKLVAALRSGKYKQGRGLLRSLNNEYCCLGVAEDLRGVDWTPGNDCYALGDTYNMLTREGRLFYGFTDNAGNFTGGVLWHLNDNEAKTFAEIADIIDSEPEGLFTWSKK